MTLASLAGVVLALVGLGVAFLFVDSRDKAGGGQGVAGMAGWVALAALVLYLAFFAPGMGPMPWTINAEIYPLDVRAVCIGASSATNWVANFVVAMTFLSLVEVCRVRRRQAIGVAALNLLCIACFVAPCRR